MALLLSAFTYFIGNQSLFLLLNGNWGAAGDITFAFITHLGETAPWVTAFILCIIYRRKFLPLLIFALLISTLFAQGIKRVLPEQPRPTKALVNNRNEIHTVANVELHTVASFPSGHTTSAFTVFLLGCLMIEKKWFIAPGFLFALLVGYSRIYLAQHFPRDVAGGMITAIISTYLALLLQNLITWKRESKQALKDVSF